MAMAWIWTGMVVVSVVFGLYNGTTGAVGAAAMEGAGAAVELCLSMAGIMCLWNGVMAVMKASGMMDGLSRLFRPVLCRLLPRACRDPDTLAALSGNVSANLLGLGNAATPLGLEASRLMAERTPGTASDGLCMLVVCNTASFQLIPTTVATVRAAAGSAAGIWKTAMILVGGFLGQSYERSKLYHPGFTTEYRQGTDTPAEGG